ncbi:MAG: Mrp/NBP35 family ATP-binding protein [Candidatus Eisenbacteria bacterium]|uniref:Iron-sulfur cluster carrier protein n=1 Tax=Eiseniibacteriota bacterium TaxID=2212470 RepID=A0A538UE30_UNCEI|nr:MAG: Mrp/NBP35 family ATP-binding protein [Candidatus Eisenbacteria bacterium]
MSVRNDDILQALGTVQDPDLHRDLVSLGMIEDLALDGGRVSFTLVLTTAACPLKAELEAQCRAAVGAVAGVTEVEIRTTSRMRKPKDPTADRKALPGVAQVIAIGAGKGGVGKSTVAANLAVALAQTGARVGLLDGDIYGPNLPRMLGVHRQPSQRNNKILPVEAWGLKFMSMGLLVEQGEAVVWRGPMLHGAIKSFLHDVDWGELDYLLVDLPPGTGDVQLSLIQQTFVAGAVVVTTPSTVSIEDAVKAIAMFDKLSVPVLGVIENMSYFTCPNCHTRHDIFNTGAGEARALAMGLTFLGAVPLHPDVRAAGDEGKPVVLSHPDSDYGRALTRIAGHLAQRISIQTVNQALETPDEATVMIAKQRPAP